MLNFLKTGQKTVKDNLLKVLNANYSAILAEKVLEDPVNPLLSRLLSLKKQSNMSTQIIMVNLKLSLIKHWWIQPWLQMDSISCLARLSTTIHNLNAESQFLRPQMTRRLEVYKNLSATAWSSLLWSMH